MSRINLLSHCPHFTRLCYVKNSPKCCLYKFVAHSSIKLVYNCRHFLHNLWTRDAKIFSRSRLVFTTSDVFMCAIHVVNTVNTTFKRVRDAKRTQHYSNVYIDNGDVTRRYFSHLSLFDNRSDCLLLHLIVRIASHLFLWQVLNILHVNKEAALSLYNTPPKPHVSLHGPYGLSAICLFSKQLRCRFRPSSWPIPTPLTPANDFL